MVLSFLPPREETRLSSVAGKILYARAESRTLRSQAASLYIDMVSSIGTVRVESGPTLRQAIGSDATGASRWWYHPVAFKNCEDHPIFDRIIAILTIARVAERLGSQELIVCGVAPELAEALSSRFRVTVIQPKWKPGRMARVARGVASRVRYGLLTFVWCFLTRRVHRIPAGQREVLFSGFWDWSVRWARSARRVEDLYFRRLPEALGQSGFTCGWFVWFSPSAASASRLWATLSSLRSTGDVMVLQTLLRYRDILRVLADFGPLRVYQSVAGKPAFRAVFTRERFDFFPLFKMELLKGFLNASIPHCELVALATQRGAERLRPKLTLSFLEHFPYSRAHYAGVRRALHGSVCVAVQHASYSWEKTFMRLHPEHEYRGRPDGLNVPCPDYVCTMGTHPRELFLSCGYQERSVLPLGSTRYDTAHDPIFDAQLGGCRTPLRVLVAPGLADSEIELVEAAWLAVGGVSDAVLRMRPHPFSRMHHGRGFDPFRERVEVTTCSLAEDLEWADLVLYTYSTVAEQAFLLGKPVWQWLPNGFNGSALADVEQIPMFATVRNLQTAVREFRARPEKYQPSASARERVYRQLFGDCRNATQKIAGFVAGLIGPGGCGVVREAGFRKSS